MVVEVGRCKNEYTSLLVPGNGQSWIMNYSAALGSILIQNLPFVILTLSLLVIPTQEESAQIFTRLQALISRNF